MTNADVPFLACDGLVYKDKIMSPFTKKRILAKNALQKEEDWNKNKFVDKH